MIYICIIAVAVAHIEGDVAAGGEIGVHGTLLVAVMTGAASTLMGRVGWTAEGIDVIVMSVVGGGASCHDAGLSSPRKARVCTLVDSSFCRLYMLCQEEEKKMMRIIRNRKTDRAGQLTGPGTNVDVLFA